jgi:hypothetical protein
MNAAIYARAGILLFALALALPSTAEAACAWVLWAHLYKGDKPVFWEPFEAYESKNDCDAGEKSLSADDKWRGERRGARYDSVLWVCFPDTIDPRGKGTTR